MVLKFKYDKGAGLPTAYGVCFPVRVLLENVEIGQISISETNRSSFSVCVIDLCGPYSETLRGTLAPHTGDIFQREMTLHNHFLSKTVFTFYKNNYANL